MARIVRRFALRLALVVMGAGLAVSGVVLLLRAVWIALAGPLGAMWASAVMGGGLVLLGAIVVLLATREKRRRAVADSDLIALLTTAFFEGLAAGRAAGRRSGVDGK